MRKMYAKAMRKALPYPFFILLFVIGIITPSAFAKNVYTIKSGNIDITLYGSEDQGNILYKYTLQDWPDEAVEAIIEALTIVDNSLVLNRKMSVAFMWTSDLEKKNNIAEAYSNYINIEGIKGLEHLDSRYKYPRELAHQLADFTYYGGNNIVVAFNSEMDWCLSKNKEPLSDQQDLITVVLHEIAHGLGISSSFTKTKEKQPYIYDKFITDSYGMNIVDSYSLFKSNTQTELTNKNLYYTGKNAVEANSGEPVKLHSPATFSSASLCHFDWIYRNNINGRLLISGTGYGISTRLFGLFAMGIFKDIGWETKTVSRSETVANENIQLEEVKVTAGQGMINIMNPDCEKLQVVIYTVQGQLVTNRVISGSETFDVKPNSIYIVKINNKVFKVRS